MGNMFGFHRNYRLRGIIGLIFIGVLLLFLAKTHSMTCIQDTCTVYSRLGLLGKVNVDYNFNRSDIAAAEIRTENHRIHRKNGGSTSHTDYVPYFIMKDGSIINLPFKSCKEEYKAQEIINRIRSNQYYKIDFPLL